MTTARTLLSRPSRALIVGGGIGGMAAAILLRRIGWAVELIDRDPDWRVYGAGITLTGPTLRAFHQLGIFDAVQARGYAGDGIDVCGMDGVVTSQIPTPRPVGADVPGSGGIMRPILHAILSEQVLAGGARVRLGLSVEALHQVGDTVEATFTDGSVAGYDLAIGADGVFSKVRGLIFPDAPGPEYTGQVCWRLSAPRPPSLVRRRYILGGPVKVGLSPVSQDQMYMFLLETTPRKARPEGPLDLYLRAMLQGFGGLLGELRDGLNADAPIIPRPLETFLLPEPWHVGNVLLIGDAAHPTQPQLASGAGLAVEDALVLAEALAGAGSVAAALPAFMARRYQRCRMVVENSIEIGRLEKAGASPPEQTAVVERSLRELAMPI